MKFRKFPKFSKNNYERLVFSNSGDRSNEFGMKLAGASYMEIHAAGGGIHYTVKKTKEASEDNLYTKLLKRLGLVYKFKNNLKISPVFKSRLLFFWTFSTFGNLYTLQNAENKHNAVYRIDNTVL